MENSSAVTLLAALAQESRLAVFRLLVQQGPEGLPAGHISARLGIAPNTLTFHLKELTHAGLLSSRQSGRFVFYATNYSVMTGLMAFLMENCCEGEGCFPELVPLCGPQGGCGNSTHADLDTRLRQGKSLIDERIAMESKVYKVLFICTGNSARSQMAEVLLNAHGRGRFKAFSAGSRPAGRIHPLAVETLHKAAYATEGLRSKSWNEFSGEGAPEIDLVFTLCDSAAGEECPVWSGRPVRAHWGIPDPGHKETDDEQRKAFHDALLILKRRIDLLTVLPMDKLDSLSLKHRLGKIGEQP